MQYFFSASTMGFYLDTVHGKAMPVDAQPISTDLYQSLKGQQIAVGQDGLPVKFVPPPVSPVPLSVTMRQARLALLAAGKLAAVEVVIGSLPSPTKEAAQIEWEFASTVDRTSPLLSTMSDALGMSSEDLDQLFMLAATL